MAVCDGAHILHAPHVPSRTLPPLRTLRALLVWEGCLSSTHAIPGLSHDNLHGIQGRAAGRNPSNSSLA